MSLARVVILALVAGALAPTALASCREPCVEFYSEESGANACDDAAPAYSAHEGFEARARLAERHWTAGASSWCWTYEDPAGPNATSGESHGFVVYATMRPVGTASWTAVEVYWEEREYWGPEYGNRECHTGADADNVPLWIVDLNVGCPAGPPPRVPLLLT